MTTVGDVGEHAVIAAIREVAPSTRNGDDAAVLPLTTPNARYIASTDMLVEGRHFSLDWSTPEQVGAKAAVQNFADVEAMGARPTAILMGLSVPKSTELEVVRGIAQGLADEGRKCAAELVGGDVVGGDSLVISITAMGELGGPGRPLVRRNARPGDVVIAAGRIGYSGAGLDLLTRFGSRAAVPEAFHPLVDAHLVPDFSYGRGPVARAAGVGALTDNSDGLVVDLTEIAVASGITIDVDEDAIAPDALQMAAADLLDTDPWRWVLAGGEDHTLLGTIAGEPPTGFRRIGDAHRDRGKPVTVGGREPWLRGGWVSF